MTLKTTMNASINNHQTSSSNEQDNNEKYRLLTVILEKKILKITKSNEKIGAR